MKEMDQYEKAWAGAHGKEYVERCDVDYSTRVPIFKKLLDKMELVFEDVLEVGCNKGHNLEAIEKANVYRPSHLYHPGKIVGIEINKDLCNKSNIINGSAYDLPWKENTFDLVFTSGVLIHIPPGRLKEAMNQMRTVSKTYVMMIEYPADKEIGTKYGEDFNNQDGVWARPYGKIYQEQFSKDVLVEHGKISDLGDDGWGFTKCDYWIFEKIS